MTFQTTDLDDLTPGAVFVREDGSKRFVLFVANATLTGKKAERFPIRVVFANENSQVFDIDVKSFFVGCKFYNIEPDLEQRLDSLFVYKGATDITLDEAVSNAQKLNEEEENKEILSFNDTEDSVKDFESITNEEQKVLKEADFLIPEITYPIAFINDNIDEKPQVTAELLSALLINYQQTPQLDTGYLLHKLTFTVPANISIDAIKSCFDVGSVRSDAIYSIFELNNTDFGSDARRIDWSHSIGAYPEYFNGKIALQIMLAEPYGTVQDSSSELPIIIQETTQFEQRNIEAELQLAENYYNALVANGNIEGEETHLNAMTDLTYLPTSAVVDSNVAAIVNSVVEVAIAPVEVVNVNPIF